MDKAFIEKRINILNQEIQQSIANHNMLLGHLSEAKHLLMELEKHEAEKRLAEDGEKADRESHHAA